MILPIFIALALQADPFKDLVSFKPNQKFAVVKSDAEWKKALPKGAYLVLRHAGTEKPYSGKFWDFHEKGKFGCIGCGQVLFSSENKYDSQTGWPSFYKEIALGRTLIRADHSEGTERTEVICARCGGHLGHVFDDGPEPTHLRYCMNSPALKFIKAP